MFLPANWPDLCGVDVVAVEDPALCASVMASCSKFTILPLPAFAITVERKSNFLT